MRLTAPRRTTGPSQLQTLHLVSSANLRHLLERSKVTMNVTCMQLMELGLTSVRMSYIVDRLITILKTTLAWMNLIRTALREARL